ncbi:RNA polymerase sigma factor [Niastella yeongjuensis]|nr:sigma-70 family RNA polymerase sigma factor [Niastella yeongjuensis]
MTRQKSKKVQKEPINRHSFIKPIIVVDLCSGHRSHNFYIRTMMIRNFNDEAVFEVLYKKYWDLLLRFAKKYINDKQTCKEVVQELFITLHVKRDQLTINVSLSSYLYRSLRNKIINHLRNESVYKKHIAIAGKKYSIISVGNEAEYWMDMIDLQREISCCLRKMPDKYRDVYVLAMQKDKTVKTTAALLQRSVPTVERQLRIAIRLMQEYLNKHKAYLQFLIPIICQLL